MLSWYTLSIIALVCYGLQNFLYNVSARRGYDTTVVMFFFMETVALLSAIALVIIGEPLTSMWLLLVFSVSNAVLFYIGTFANIEALKHLPSGIVYPIMRSSVVIVIIISLLFFNETLNLTQGIGIVLSIAVIYILVQKDEVRLENKSTFKKGIFYTLVVLVTGSTVTIILKLAAERVEPVGLIAISYGINSVIAYVLYSRQTSMNGIVKKADNSFSRAIIVGVAAGVVNLIGFYMLLEAFASGPLSLVSTIVGLAFVIPILLSMVFLKEKVTVPRLAALALAVLATILLRM